MLSAGNSNYQLPVLTTFSTLSCCMIGNAPTAPSPIRSATRSRTIRERFFFKPSALTLNLSISSSVSLRVRTTLRIVFLSFRFLDVIFAPLVVAPSIIQGNALPFLVLRLRASRISLLSCILMWALTDFHLKRSLITAAKQSHSTTGGGDADRQRKES